MPCLYQTCFHIDGSDKSYAAYLLSDLLRVNLIHNGGRLSNENSTGRKNKMANENNQLVISVMLAVEDAPAACAWYKEALGATELWNLGSVIGLEIAGAAFFLGQPENNGWEIPTKAWCYNDKDRGILQ